MKDLMHKELVQGWKNEVKRLQAEIEHKNKIIKQLKELVEMLDTTGQAGMIPASTLKQLLPEK